jgi:anti-anti-sigma factor
MEAKVESRDGIYVVSLAGQLDFESADALRNNCRQMFSDKKVIFNLEALNFVGSSGLTPFLDLLKDMKKNLGKNVKICAAQKDFVRLFETGGDLSQIEIYESEEKAHNAFIFAQFMTEAEKRAKGPEGVIRRVKSFGLDYPMEEDGE